MRSARRGGTVLAAAALVALSLALGASQARPGDSITLTVIAQATKQPAFDVLVPNFERVHPSVKVDVTYAASAGDRSQLELVELAAGNAPDVLSVQPGSGSTVSVPPLARAGHLAPLLHKPWVRWSMPSIISADKYGAGLFAFTPSLSAWGIFTNDDLFKKLGLKVPRTFGQLLDLCGQAKAAGTVAVLFPAISDVGSLASDLAVNIVYGKDEQWASKRRAGTVTFAASKGWHQALQMVVDMNDAGCFQPGDAATSLASARAQFAQGQGLMYTQLTGEKGQIDLASPQFTYSHHPYPAGIDPNQTRVMIQAGESFGVNAHSRAQDQAAAQTFIDFIARPKQDALYAQTTGFQTQYQFLHRQFPGFMSDDAAAITQDRYMLNPITFWWNSAVGTALSQNALGLLTGQRSVDDVLGAMDAAWKQGPG